MSECLVIEKLPFPVHLLELYQQIAECSLKPLDVLAFDLFQILTAETLGLDTAIREFVLNEYFCELDENNQSYSPINIYKGLAFLVEHLRKELIVKFNRDCFKHMASLHMASPTDVQIIFVFNQGKHPHPSSRKIP